MTVTEYAYTEQDIYTAIVQTAVPIALTADETALLVAELINAADGTMETPAAIFFDLRRRIGASPIAGERSALESPISRWRQHLTYLASVAARSAVLARQAADYPSLKGGV